MRMLLFIHFSSSSLKLQAVTLGYINVAESVHPVNVKLFVPMDKRKSKVTNQMQPMIIGYS